MQNGVRQVMSIWQLVAIVFTVITVNTRPLGTKHELVPCLALHT